MSQKVISVEHLSKAYRLGQIGTGTLTNDLKVWWAKKLGWPNPMLKIGETDHGNRDGETIWALKDVNLQVERGDVLGIIGRNGAGKSTLLKILSCVTAPTSGCVRVKGRIASLLEVGTGFHPDLTGRENIFLNGAILGMTTEEVRRKMDEIVAFAEIEQFLDTPVKRYSSGMYVRLAFAVAANLESENLLVDEVLSVGDAEFQKKCLGKMGDVASKEGRTVLFVSHNMGAIQQLCSYSILFSKGKLIEFGLSNEIIQKYLNLHTIDSDTVDLSILPRQQATKFVKFIRVQLQNQAHVPCNEFMLGDDITIVFETTNTNQAFISKNLYSVLIRSNDGVPIANCNNTDSGFTLQGNSRQKDIFEVTFRNMCLYPGRYHISLWTGDSMDTHDWVENCIAFEIVSGGKLTTRPLKRHDGLFFFTPQWRLLEANEAKTSRAL
jgi:lipopolysaccharide transport system ATP-binding protein